MLSFEFKFKTFFIFRYFVVPSWYDINFLIHKFSFLPFRKCFSSSFLPPPPPHPLLPLLLLLLLNIAGFIPAGVFVRNTKEEATSHFRKKRLLVSLAKQGSSSKAQAQQTRAGTFSRPWEPRMRD